MMEKFSLKNIIWVIFGFICGYYAGQIAGGLLGTIVWAFVGVVFGGLVYQAASTVIISTILSIVFGVLLAFLIWSFDKRLFGARTPSILWGLAGAIAGLIVMFTYGINVISHPELYGNFNGLNPLDGYIFDINRYYNPLPQPWRLPMLQYGGGTGQLIGIYLGILAGLFISIRETIAKKRKAEDKQEFDAYSNFFKEHLKK